MGYRGPGLRVVFSNKGSEESEAAAAEAEAAKHQLEKCKQALADARHELACSQDLVSLKNDDIKDLQKNL